MTVARELNEYETLSAYFRRKHPKVKDFGAFRSTTVGKPAMYDVGNVIGR